MRHIALTSLVVATIGALWLAYPVISGANSDTDASACLNPSSTAPAPGSTEAIRAAVLEDRDCLAHYVDQHGAQVAGVVFEAGYPSLLTDVLAPADLLTTVENLALAGDRIAYSDDTELAPALAQMAAEQPDVAPRALRLRDVVLAAMEAPGPPPTDRATYLMARPVWLMSDQQWSAFCEEFDCTATPDCTVNGALKYQAREGMDAVATALSACEIDAGLALSLRASGIMGRGCSSTMQVNALIGGAIDDAATCPELLAAPLGNAYSSLDLISLLRGVRRGDLSLSPQALTSFQAAHPELATLLQP